MHILTHLEHKSYGGGGRKIFEPQEFLFVIKFLVWFFLGRTMNIF